MNKAAPIFADPVLQERFDRNGYVTFPMLTEEQANTLYSFYMDNRVEHEATGNLQHSTSDTTNIDLIKKVDTYLKPILVPALQKFMPAFNYLISGYLVKEPGENSQTGMHQDPTFVDEPQFLSGNVWIALGDIGHDNGNMYFIKGSHRLVPMMRVTPTCPTALDDVHPIPPEYLTEVPVRKGEAIFFNHGTFHGSTPNISTKPRIVSVMAVGSKDSQWLVHYMEKGAPFDKIEKYKLPTQDSFIEMEKDKRPAKGEFIGYVSWNFPKMSKEDFIREMDKIHGYKKNGLLNKLRAFIKKPAAV